MNAIDNAGMRPLHLASRLEPLDILIKFGADLNAQNNEGNTLAHYMCNKGSYVVDFLIKHCDLTIQNNNKKLPSDYCTSEHHRVLLQNAERKQMLRKLWIMEEPRFDNYIQWIPNELLDDLP